MSVHDLGAERARRDGHRTQAEIEAQLKARLAELEVEAERMKADPMLNFPCATCRYQSPVGTDGHEWGAPENIEKYGTCVNPLVKGLAKFGPRFDPIPPLCGPEKALWRPKLTRWQRLIAWLEDLLA